MDQKRRINMAGKKKTDTPDFAAFTEMLQSNGLKLAGKANTKKMLIELAQQTQALTKKDIRSWRNAWQMAISVENPTRIPLYSIYTDVDIDMHVTGCIDQRTRMVKQKSFKLVDKDGNENEEVSEIFENTGLKT